MLRLAVRGPLYAQQLRPSGRTSSSDFNSMPPHGYRWAAPSVDRGSGTNTNRTYHCRHSTGGVGGGRCTEKEKEKEKETKEMTML